MTLDVRMQVAAACEVQIQHAFALAAANGLAPRDVVVALLDTEGSIWATHKTFAGMRRVPVVVDGRTWRVTCAVLDRESVLAWWGTIYTASCATLRALPDHRNTFVLGFGESTGATLLSAPMTGANDTGGP